MKTFLFFGVFNDFIFHQPEKIFVWNSSLNVSNLKLLTLVNTSLQEVAKNCCSPMRESLKDIFVLSFLLIICTKGKCLHVSVHWTKIGSKCVVFLVLLLHVHFRQLDYMYIFVVLCVLMRMTYKENGDLLVWNDDMWGN